MKTIILIFVTIVVAGGCEKKPSIISPAPVPSPQDETTVNIACPKSGDIAEFTADPLPDKTHFKNFKVERKDLEDILSTWHLLPQDHWEHGYSHVAFGNRTGTIELKDGTTIRWMVKPGGLATLTFQTDTMLYLAKELTPWEKNTEQAIPVPLFNRIDYLKPMNYVSLPADIGNAKRIETIATQLKSQTPESSLRAIDQWMKKNLRYDPNAAYHWRNFDQIVDDGIIGGCADHSIVFGALSRACSIPTVWVKTMDYDWIREFKLLGPIGSWRGHVFLEVYIHDKWVLLDAQGMILYEDYDPNSHFFPGGRYAYDKGPDPYELILSVRWDIWKKQTADYFAGFDVSSLPGFGRGRDISGRGIYIAADSPIWRWVQDLCSSQGYSVRKSFNTGFDIFLPEARGNILIITCVGNRIILPEKYRTEFLPITTDQIKARLKTEKFGIARRRLNDGTRVILIFGIDNESIKKAIEIFIVEETE